MLSFSFFYMVSEYGWWPTVISLLYFPTMEEQPKNPKNVSTPNQKYKPKKMLLIISISLIQTI